MQRPQELKEMKEEFEDEPGELVRLAFESCVKLYGHNWDGMWGGTQCETVKCWIAGYKAKSEETADFDREWCNR